MSRGVWLSVGAGVAAQDFVGIGGLHRDDALLCFAKNRSHVGEIKLAMVVVGAQVVDISYPGFFETLERLVQ